MVRQGQMSLRVRFRRKMFGWLVRAGVGWPEPVALPRVAYEHTYI